MNRRGRKLSPEEAALWARVAKTVSPLVDKAQPMPTLDVDLPSRGKVDLPSRGKTAAAPPVLARPVRPSRAAAPQSIGGAHPVGAHGLDTGWDRKLARGLVEPDFTLDLHGCTLDAAHGRLLHGLSQARAMGARLVLLVTGKPRPVDPADRMARRGAIRAKVIDWIAASDNALDIAAIRGAHRRHGGQGALYVILKRRRA